MVFSSIFFIFTFLPITLGLYFISPKIIKNAVLLLVSLFFYAWGEPVYVFLMLFTIIFDYGMGLLMDSYEGKTRKRLFIVTVIVNLGFLFFFKYYGFLIQNINQIFNVGMPNDPLPLPIGISFYTFQI